MKNMKLGLLFSTAAMAFAVGCGEIGGGSDGGTEGASCTSDDNCAVGYACNLGTHECQETCTASEVPNGCPASTPVCASVKNSTATFCRCNSDTTCNGNGSGTTTPYCNQDSGKCQATAWVPATCTPVTDNAACAAADSTKPFCNYQTMTCSDTQGTPPGPLACTGTLTSKQPEVCGYGSWCSDADAHCAEIANGTCSNITSSTQTWTATQTAKGPVFFKFRDESEAGADPCPTPTDTRYTYFLHAYAGTDLGEWPATRGGLPNSTYYLTNGTASVKINSHLEDMTHGYDRCGDNGVTCDAPDKSIAKFHPTVCTSSASGFQGAYAFDHGNGFCFNAIHN